MGTKITIAGAAGRMGQMLVRCAETVPAVRVVGAVERPDHPDLGKDVGEIAGIAKTGILLSGDLAESLRDADVLVDFTSHDSTLLNVETAAQAGKAAVTGVTAMTEDESASLRQLANRIPVVASPNMSLGVNLLFAFVERAASVLGGDYSIEIDDTHHVHKKDSPSGTALRLGEKAAAGRGIDFSTEMIHDPEGKDGVADPAKIVVRSHRQGEVVGDHTVSFENSAEKIEFTHHAWTRDAFALGALQAAGWVVGREPGLYSMQDVLGL
jgi:4-hydroxy-tetrahydrodipicolinate reductase